MDNNIPFQIIDWTKIPKTEHRGETGVAHRQTLQFDGLRIRIVEYSEGYAANHWCKKGHIVHCLEGEVVNEQQDGTHSILTPGMSYFGNIWMSNKKPKRFKMNGRVVFFREFVKHPLQIGSIIPSSRFLERRIVEAAGIPSARVIIELGPGIGGITRAILRAMPQQARLLSVEINPNFHRMVSKIADDRLIAHLGSASDLRETISQYGLDPPDAIVSGIPFSTMSHHIGSQIAETISSVLPPSGRFVAYQVNNHVADLCQPFLGSWQSSVEFLNIPPMRVFQWEKSA